MEPESTYIVIRTDEEIEELIERACQPFRTKDDESYAEGIFNTIEWLFDDAVANPLGG